MAGGLDAGDVRPELVGDEDLIEGGLASLTDPLGAGEELAAAGRGQEADLKVQGDRDRVPVVGGDREGEVGHGRVDSAHHAVGSVLVAAFSDAGDKGVARSGLLDHDSGGFGGKVVFFKKCACVFDVSHGEFLFSFSLFKRILVKENVTQNIRNYKHKDMNKVNYQRELEKIILKNEKNGVVPSLLLHSCCAPCSSWCLEYLTDYFQVTDFYYNPNITDAEEYGRRERELMRLIAQQPHKYPVTFLHGDYEPKKFYEAVRGFENYREGGERCFICYELRLRETALQAKKRGMDYFGTTLTISPLKNAQKLNEIGERLEAEIGQSKIITESEALDVIPETMGKRASNEEGTRRQAGNAETRIGKPIWLPSDFKKKGGYQRSIELSKVYDLYRQDFCGCSFSKAEREMSLKQTKES